MRTRLTLFACAALVLVAMASPVEAGRRSYVSIRFDPFWWGWGSAWGYYHRPYYPSRYYPVAETVVSRDVGAVDLNVKPKKTSVYVDGQLAGNASRFDGFPGYLWLDDGVHQLVLEHDGYVTLARDIEVRGGSLVDLRVEMQRGESRPATELFAVVEEPRQEKAPSAVAPYSEEERSRVRRRESTAAREPRTLDARADGARLQVEITPRDASVYLDGRFLGTVEDLERLHAGILVDSGEHTLSAVRPGYEESVLNFEAVSGEEVVLTIDLEEE